MRRVLGYENGRPIWSENEPAHVPSHSLSGSLVVGGPGPYDRQRQADYQRKHVAKVAAERTTP